MFILFIFFTVFSSVTNLNEKCDDNIFILITAKKIFLLNFPSSTPNIIYQTKSNQTIENGLFHKRTNTIILLINHFNQTYSLRSLNTHDNIFNPWIEKSHQISSSSLIYLSLGQTYLYLLNNQTRLLQIYNLPLTSKLFKENYLLNLPNNQTIINYLIDEKIQFLWILFERELYSCQLNIYSCHLILSLVYKPIQLYINWNSQQLFVHSKSYLIILEYNQNQTNTHYLNSTREEFLTICEKNNQIEYLTIHSINQRQVCFQTCQDLFNDTSRVKTIQRLTTSSNILYCSKQRRISKLIIMILILIDIAVVLGMISWLAYKYFYQSTLKKNTKQTSNGSIWTIEKDFITHF